MKNEEELKQAVNTQLDTLNATQLEDLHRFLDSNPQFALRQLHEMKRAIYDYLETLKERGDFEDVFRELLRELGYVCLDKKTKHGSGEHGVDIAATLTEGSQTTMHYFQLKAGDISTAKWRNEIRGELLPLLDSASSYRFNPHHYPAQGHFVYTGDLQGDASPEFDAFNAGNIN